MLSADDDADGLLFGQSQLLRPALSALRKLLKLRIADAGRREIERPDEGRAPL